MEATQSVSRFFEPPHPNHEEKYRLAGEISEMAATIHAAEFRLLEKMRRFDEIGGWGMVDARSFPDWLSWNAGWDLRDGREKVRVARALGKLPEISESMRKGELSFSKVRAITRIATPENEKGLLDTTKCTSAAQLVRFTRACRMADRNEERSRATRMEEKRYLRLIPEEDGMLSVRGLLTPEVGTVVDRAIGAACDRLYKDEKEAIKERGPTAPLPCDPITGSPLSPSQRRADALRLVAEAALKDGLDSGTRGDRYQVVLHVDADVLADPDKEGKSFFDDGRAVSPDTARRIACDSALVVAQHDREGNLLDLGRKTRVISPALRRALQYRDPRCLFPSCNIRFCEGHHQKHWAEGGETKLWNLLNLCFRHHVAVHEGGYRVEPMPDGTFAFYNPYGHPLPQAVTPPTLEGDPVAALEAANREAGVVINDWTCWPKNADETIDLDLMVSCFIWDEVRRRRDDDEDDEEERGPP